MRRAPLRRVRNTFHTQGGASEEIPQKDVSGRTGGLLKSQHLARDTGAPNILVWLALQAQIPSFSWREFHQPGSGPER